MAEKFQLKALITGVDRLSPTLAGVRKNIAGFRKGLQATGLGEVGLRDILAGAAIAAPFIAGTQAAIELESALADVRKVVNFDTPEQFAQMGEDIGKMSERLPMAATDIAKIVAAGGQAGFARSELLGFAEAAVKMGIAFDQTADESGEMMSKWRTAFRLTQPEVETLADKINYLGNTGPANAKTISNIVTEIGALGEVAGLSSGQVAALGATMAGVGVKQDVAATGIKNFMLALTKGTAATKSQQQAFKSIGLDARKVAKAMQVNSQGTILDILQRIRDVKPEARAALLTELFGSESVAAITPLATGLDVVRANLQKVSDAQQYGGSMEQEYAARAATTANSLQLLRNGITRVGVAIGSAFLGPITEASAALMPYVSRIGDLIKAHPDLVRGLATAGVAFAAISSAIAGAVVVTKLWGVVFGATPIGIIAAGIALAAGLIVANWDVLGPFFSELWGSIKTFALVAWEVIKSVVAWHPLGLIVSNWQPLAEFFSALWELIKAAVGVGWAYIKEQIGFDPVAVVTGAWEPLVGFFKGLFDRIKPYVEPLMSAGAWLGDKAGAVGSWAKGAAGQVSSFFGGTNPGNAAGGLIGTSTQGVRNLTQNLQNSGSLVQQTANANRPQLDGALVVRFENAPAGLRTEQATTNQPGLKVTSNVGYRSLAGAP